MKVKFYNWAREQKCKEVLDQFDFNDKTIELDEGELCFHMMMMFAQGINVMISHSIQDDYDVLFAVDPRRFNQR